MTAANDTPKRMTLTTEQHEALAWALSAITPVLIEPSARKHRDVLQALLGVEPHA